LQATVDQASAQVSTAEKNLQNATIVAPFDGSISQVTGDVGSLVTANTTVFILLNQNLLRIDASVDQADLSNLRQGQVGTVTFDALPGRTFQATIAAIGLTPTISSGVVTYSVQFALDTSRLTAPLPAPGMTAAITVTTQRTENALVVPTRAVRRSAGRATVTVKKADGTQEQRMVVTVVSNSQLTQVTNGLQDGEQVLVSSGTSAPTSGGISLTPAAGPGGGGAPVGPPPGGP
jgi:RND family efflux transporter MFP subunit